ncbi:MAG: hypothetical protein KJO03_08065, partial [Gammaproteobacteria bacterium]|nr:hypothetical protein [Gammaproteobacteria bacterium]
MSQEFYGCFTGHGITARNERLRWYDIPVGRKNRYPDFIILHPARGLLFLEVKDWRLENIK